MATATARTEQAPMIHIDALPFLRMVSRLVSTAFSERKRGV